MWQLDVVRPKDGQLVFDLAAAPICESLTVAYNGVLLSPPDDYGVVWNGSVHQVVFTSSYTPNPTDLVRIQYQSC